MPTADASREAAALNQNDYLRVVLVVLTVAAIIGATLSGALVIVVRDGNQTAKLANRTAQRVDRNTRRLERQQAQVRRATQRVDRLRRTVVRSGFLLNCRSIRRLARDHVHLGQGQELARLPCEKLAQRFLGGSSRR